jgi:hypothetical protein
MPKKPAEEAAPTEASEEQDFTPCHEQGATAKAIGLTRDDCPYKADGPLRDAWLAGFDAE